MELNEKRNYSNINRIEKNLIKPANEHPKIQSNAKFKNSRNIFSKNKNKSSLNFGINKNFMLSYNKSQDIPNKNEELCINDYNSINNYKTILINSSQLDANYFKKKLPKNINNKNFSSKTIDLKNNKSIFSWFNLVQNKRKKIDFIKYKSLLGKKNQIKRLFQHNDCGFPLDNTKQINPLLIIDKKKYISRNKYKNNSLPNINSIHNNKSNYINIRIKKFNLSNEAKEPNKLIFEYNKTKNIILNKDNNLIKKFKNHKEHETIINDNYKEYLKSISSSESNKSKSEINKLIKRNRNHKIKNLQSLLNKSTIYEKKNIYSNTKRTNKTNNSYTKIKKDNYNKILKLKKFISHRSKFLEHINKSITIGNPNLKEKILLE